MLQLLIAIFSVFSLLACGGLKEDAKPSSGGSGAVGVYSLTGVRLGDFLGIAHDGPAFKTAEGYFAFMSQLGYLSNFMTKWGVLSPGGGTVCYFVSNDCSGECLVGDFEFMKNTIYYAGQLYVSTGFEVRQTISQNSSITYNQNNVGTCNVGGPPTVNVIKPLKKWTPPAGVTFPMTNWYLQ